VPLARPLPPFAGVGMPTRSGATSVIEEPPATPSPIPPSPYGQADELPENPF
jgi:hypothetical protein